MSAWLGAGALGVGLSAAVLGGTAVAHADTGDASGGIGHGARTGSAKTSANAESAPRSPRAAAATRAARGSVSPAAAVPASEGRSGNAVAVTPSSGVGNAGSVVGQRAAAAVRSAAVSQPSPVAAADAPAPAVLAPKASATGKAVGWQPGSVYSLFISDGSLTHPDAGLWIGNGFSYNADTCPDGGCNGGRAGLIYGNGGNGWGGGNGLRTSTDTSRPTAPPKTATSHASLRRIRRSSAVQPG